MYPCMEMQKAIVRVPAACVLLLNTRDGLIQHLKVLMHCYNNITVHRYIVIMLQRWQNVLFKVIIT